MGAQKRLIEENETCPACGADMHLNEDGEVECGSYEPCDSQAAGGERGLSDIES